ncbi:helix-turn-helix domain-containing protein [Nocardiopsis mangrovi]|uniref:Helix-turn-helix domain-containing protein n=1 Tax=Nocardiopsis mangrovi TaxID=1179818 RepID=A0ABV9E136_9ACTN
MDAYDTGGAGGDLGRRAAHRRKGLGLTHEEVALRAGMAPGYVAYLEEHPPVLTRWALYRLARALQTTEDVLLGAEPEGAPGLPGSPVPDPELRDLDPEECARLLEPGGVGRVAFLVEGERAPMVLPVNYLVSAGTIVFRADPDGVIAHHALGEVGFQVDRFDGAMSEGWTVLAAGPARRVEEPSELSALRALTPIRPWAGGDRDACVRITPARLTGHRLRPREA